MTLLRIVLAMLALASLSACVSPLDAPPADQIARNAYVSSKPTSVTLVTMINGENGKGEHSALLINGSERVLYDPAGSFSLPKYVHENRDIHYGVTDEVMNIYNYYHARRSHYVEMLTLNVPRDMADQLISRADAQGPQPKMFCGQAVSKVLKPVGPFGDVPITFWPGPIHEAFRKVPGVTSEIVREDDVGQNITFAPKS